MESGKGREKILSMIKSLKTLLNLLLLSSLSACLIKEDPKATHSELLVTKGNVVVSSVTSDSLVAFNEDGDFVKIIYQLPNTADAISSLAWLPDTNEILISINGTPDRIEALNVQTGAVRNFYNNTTYYTGTPAAIGVLKNSGDVISSEGATIERFSASGLREVWTTIWPTNVHANSQQIVGLANGNWLSCSSSAGMRISPDSTTNLAAVASVASAIAGTTATYGCAEMSDGSIVVAWNGTTDSVQTYSSTLTGPTTIYSDTVALGNPRGLAVNDNDEIYVSDATRNVIIHLDSSGTVIREFGFGYLQAPGAILVIPDFN